MTCLTTPCVSSVLLVVSLNRIQHATCCYCKLILDVLCECFSLFIVLGCCWCPTVVVAVAFTVADVPLQGRILYKVKATLLCQECLKVRNNIIDFRQKNNKDNTSVQKNESAVIPRSPSGNNHRNYQVNPKKCPPIMVLRGYLDSRLFTLV